MSDRRLPIMTVIEHADDLHVAGACGLSASRQGRRRQDRRASADRTPIRIAEGEMVDCDYAAWRT